MYLLKSFAFEDKIKSLIRFIMCNIYIYICFNIKRPHYNMKLHCLNPSSAYQVVVNKRKQKNGVQFKMT